MPCWKLVRDGIGVELSKRGVVVRRVSDQSLLEKLLRLKVVEEALEFLESGSVEEVADIVEALDAWLRLRGVDWSSVEALRRAKRGRVGGFEEGYVVFWDDRDEC